MEMLSELNSIVEKKSTSFFYDPVNVACKNFIYAIQKKGLQFLQPFEFKLLFDKFQLPYRIALPYLCNINTWLVPAA